MPLYRIQSDAQNFLIDFDGTLGKYGFFTHRFVSADDPGAAETAAIEMLRSDQELRALVKNDPDDPPTMYVTEIAELDETEVQALEQPGRAWYEMRRKRWWQFWR